jgi:hypothetical protein
MKLSNQAMWRILIIVSLTIICITAIAIANSTYTINLNMDNNTLEAIKTINWSAIPK